MRKKTKDENRRRAQPSADSYAAFEKQLKKVPAAERYLLRLYVTGTTQRSTRAIANIRSLCEEFLKGRYKLDVIDIYQHPVETMNAQIFAAPTLIKRSPKPVKRLIGDLSNRDRLIYDLDLQGPHAAPPTAITGVIAL